VKRGKRVEARRNICPRSYLASLLSQVYGGLVSGVGRWSDLVVLGAVEQFTGVRASTI
jgi:hypothetical protein